MGLPLKEIAEKEHDFRLAQGSSARGANNSSVTSTRATPATRLDAARLLLDRGLSRKAEAQLTDLIKSMRHDKTFLARARCALAEARAMDGHFNDSLAVIQSYESPEARRGLDPEIDIQLRVQLGLAFNHTGDYPKAIALLNTALRDTPETDADAARAVIFDALARV